VTLETVAFEGHECVRLSDGDVSLLVTTSVGPRVLGLVTMRGNVFAVLPDATLEGPGGERYRLVGGHRLWAAPEVVDVTYQPDDRPCAVAAVDRGVRVEAPPDGVGIVKVIEARVVADGWLVDHVLRNESSEPMTIAPWAITQLRMGGVAEIPLGPLGAGLQPDRSVVLWPYTDLADPRVAFESGRICVDARPTGSRLKLGVAPSEGRVSYRLDDVVFEKRVAVDPAATHPDRGAVVEVFVCDDFCELESVGPLAEVPPGGATSHRERWVVRTVDGGTA
jgi:hypothetical protein